MARVVSGIQPTGTIHLGNYLGMIRPALDLALEHEAYYFVADYHALNAGPDPDRLRTASVGVSATLLALGLDPAQTVLYRQSDVPEVCELTQILAAVTAKGLLNRAHAYKAAVAANEQRGLDPDVGVNLGLYGYPLLMAADILAPAGELVPVGFDQKQHLEIARGIAGAFNGRYGDVLVVPDPHIDVATMTVPGTDGRKMSKSYGNTIPILAPPDDIRSAVASIVTDSRPVHASKDPHTDVLFRLFSLVADPAESAALADHYRAGGVRYGKVKRRLADLLVDRFERPRARFLELSNEAVELDRILAAGAERARDSCSRTLRAVKRAIGLPTRAA